MPAPQGSRRSGWACTSRVRRAGRQLPRLSWAGKGRPERAAWHRSIHFSFGAVIHYHCVNRTPLPDKSSLVHHTPHTMTPLSEKSSLLTNSPARGCHYANGSGKRKCFSSERVSETCIPLFISLFLEGWAWTQPLSPSSPYLEAGALPLSRDTMYGKTSEGLAPGTRRRAFILNKN